MDVTSIIVEAIATRVEAIALRLEAISQIEELKLRTDHMEKGRNKAGWHKVLDQS